MTITARVLNILELRELDGIWQPKLVLEMEWFDSRLKMQNLKDDIQLNILGNEEKDDPWFPIVIFMNHKHRERLVLDDKTSLVVRKEGNGSANTLADLNAAKVYYGEENPFFYVRSYTVDLECVFNLRSYPFDTQACFIILGVPHGLRNKVELIAKETIVKPTIQLAQFEIQSSLVHNNQTNKQTSGKAYFIVILKRKVAYHLISVYIPSLSLLVISLSTMHISVDHFEANIMVHLTAMLVMYTLFQAISVSLPKVIQS